MPGRVVVVGGSGNVGTAVLRAIGADPALEAAGVSRRRPPYEGVPWHEIDIGRADSAPLLEAAFTGTDAVVHAAWVLQPSHDRTLLRRINVDGSARVFAAAAKAGVRHIVYLSSIGAYSPGPTDQRVGEEWPTEGVPSSFYARHKAAVERQLDKLEATHSELTVTRLRPGLIMQRAAASEIQRYFIGPLVPPQLFRLAADRKLPLLPLPGDLRLQFVHADDVAAAVVSALREGWAGAVNLAAEPVITPAALAELVGARHVPVPAFLLRAMAAASWHLRLQPTAPGWIDLAMSIPPMSTARARDELGWQPGHTAEQAVTEILNGLADGAGTDSPPLLPR